ncbi:HAD hydrolase-like protein [Streptomyces sp. AcH 505]|uniref:HAD family hydrolase n=1 Tax=Streptomyces sp. AcH 505 TaxID=352211 RepID=UPI000A9F899A
MSLLLELLEPVTCVMFDFDGPVCHLFAGHPAEQVADDLVSCLRTLNTEELLRAEGVNWKDPHAVVRLAGRLYPNSGLVETLEERLTAHELRAAHGAIPTTHADELIRALWAKSYKLAVTTNNSASVVESYLSTKGLLDYFAPHVHGRTKDLLRLKPDPDCLIRALESTGAAAAESLMIGDTGADCEAAHKAGIAFIGYAKTEAKRVQLKSAGAERIVSSLDQVLEAVRGG